MEEASGIDLDWFWRGWFYTTDHVDISLDKIYKMRLDTKNPDIDFARRREEAKGAPAKRNVILNEENNVPIWTELRPDVKDFHDENDRFTSTNADRNKFNGFVKGLKDWEKEAFERAIKEDKNYYVLEFSNVGGLVMPIILGLEYTDGSKERLYIPAEIWRRNPHSVRKPIVTEKDKTLEQVVVDPNWETADTDIENNYYPRRIIDSRVEAFKRSRGFSFTGRDLMKDSKAKLKTDEKKDDKKDKKKD